MTFSKSVKISDLILTVGEFHTILLPEATSMIVLLCIVSCPYLIIYFLFEHRSVNGQQGTPMRSGNPGESRVSYNLLPI